MKILSVNIPGKEYKIYIEKGLIKRIGEMIKPYARGERISIITDRNLDKLYGEDLEKNLRASGFQVKRIVVHPGEKSKSLETLEYIYSELIHFSMTRRDLILAFGGGVVGDLAGFAASSFLRGLDFIQIPTSLLAQIDSSIGGKVAINLRQGKNLVGSFYQPLAVFIDPGLLETLDKENFKDGMGELIKYACIRDKDLFDKLLAYGEEEFSGHIEDIIWRSLDIKRDIVERDEMDRGERMLLNLGHTLGHAIEKYYDYNYSHGQAVAIGIYHISKKSEEQGLTRPGTSEKIKEILKKYQLDYKMPEIDRKSLIELVSRDKKRSGDSINIVLLEEIGRAFIKEISMEDMEDFI